MKVFFDTSAFIKRYIEEPESQKVNQICRLADFLVLSIICLPEMISTLNRLVRERKITAVKYQELKKLIMGDLDDIEICNLSPDNIAHSLKCLEKSPLRAMDAIHLSCAIVTQPDLFVSSDLKQIEAAKREGLKVQVV